MENSNLSYFFYKENSLFLSDTRNSILPRSVAVHGENIYVNYRFPNNSVIQYKQSKYNKIELVSKWSSSNISLQDFNFPTGIARFENVLYIADTFNHRIIKKDITSFEDKTFDVTTTEEEVITSDSLLFPAGVAVDEEGFLYVANPGNFLVQKFDSQGNLVTQWGNLSKDLGNNQLEVGENQIDPLLSNNSIILPTGIAVDEHYVYVVDSLRASIDVFTKEGEFQFSFGSRGENIDEFGLPLGIAVTQNYIFIADFSKKQIKKFDKFGYFIEVWQANSAPCTSTQCVQLQIQSLDEPTFISADKYDRLYLTDLETNRIYKLTTHGELITTWGEQGIYASQFSRIAGIVPNEDGSEIYVTDLVANRVTSFKTGNVFPKQKAIIITGNDDGEYGDALQINANQAYRVLRSKGFRKEDIYYIAPREDDDKHNIDIDGNGLADDINANLTLDNLEYAVTQWAMKDSEDSILIYIISHGIEQEIVLEPNSSTMTNLSYSTVANTLKTLGNAGHKIQFIYDACYSGTFEGLINEHENIEYVITSSSNEKATFSQHGVSFSNLFWANIFNGNTVKQAFKSATSNLSEQTPKIKTHFESQDWEIGLPRQSPENTLKIEEINLSPARVDLSNNFSDISKKLHIEAKITQESSLPVKVWIEIIPPKISNITDVMLTSDNSKPVLGYPNLTLQNINKGNLYNGNYSFDNIKILKNDNILDSGTKYTAKVYARQGSHIVSESKTFEIVGSKEFKAMIIENQKELDVEKVYTALSYQGYTSNDIEYLSNSPDCDILQCEKALPKKATCENIKDSLDNNYHNTKFLTIYASSKFLIKCNNVVDALNSLQSKMPVLVVYYGNGPSNEFSLKDLSSPIKKNRVVLDFSNMELLHLFWQTIASGESLNEAIITVKDSVSTISPNTEFKFDLNSDGIPDTKIPDNLNFEIKDRERQIYIGSGIRYAVMDNMTSNVRRESGRFTGFSTRFYVSYGTTPTTAKFSIEGSQPKQVFIGVMGIAQGQDKLPNLTMVVENENGKKITGMTSNAFNLQPSTYTIKVSLAPNSSPGIGLVAIYDMENASSTSTLTSLVTTSDVGKQAEDYIYGGFSIRDGPAHVILRGLGQGLQTRGIQTNLDARLILRNYPEGNFIVSNSDWKLNTLADQKALEKQKLNRIDTSDTAIIHNLPAGDYTLELAGEYNSFGMGQIEINIVE